MGLAVGVLAVTFVVNVTHLGEPRPVEPPTVVPAPAFDNALAAGPLQTAFLAGGCFWGTQAVFEHVKGVRQVLAGYAGGPASTANYQSVSTGRSGHAESIRVIFDPAEISYGQILRVFFSVAHDPTELNRQGPDEGAQYRSLIFYVDPGQQKIARDYLTQLEQAHVFKRPIVTRVEPQQPFYQAEGYHQDYLVGHPKQLYIVYNDLPKIANLQRLFPGAYRDKPLLLRDNPDPTDTPPGEVMATLK